MGSRVNLPNFLNIEATPQPIAAGVYLAQVADVQAKTSKNKGDSYLSWQFTVVEDKTNGGKFVGRKLFHNTFLSEKSVFTTKQVTNACGVTGDQAGFDLDMCKGKKVSIAVSIEDYNGNQVNRVDRVMTPQL